MWLEMVRQKRGAPTLRQLQKQVLDRRASTSGEAEIARSHPRALLGS